MDFQVVEFYRCPPGLANFVVATFSDLLAYVRVKGAVSFGWIFNGLLQGCPFASLLFDAAVEPILVKPSEVVDKVQNGITRACADDIGMALGSIWTLIEVSRIFDMCEALTGLSLNVVKCVLIPTSRKFTCQLVEIIRDWLRRHVPRWASFSVSDSGEYLGVWVGPGSSRLNWAKQRAQWRETVCKIAGAHVAAGAATDLYRIYSAYVLGYLG